MEPTLHYRSQLQSELNRRRLVNPLYSMRAFAKLLEISPAHLSKVLRGEKALSIDSAMKIAERLQYSENESLQFCQLVQHSRLHSPKLKQALRLESSVESEGSFSPLSLEVFQVISDWHHLALREYTECRDFKPTPARIAARLGISEAEAELALRRLVRIGLLEKRGGNYKKTAASVTTAGTDRPKQALKSYHGQMLELAKRALDEQSSEERDISGITLPISLDKLDVARDEIKKFRRKMMKLLESSKASEVYQLNLQFFRLTKKEGERS